MDEPASRDRPLAAVVYNPVKVDVNRMSAAVRAAAARAGWATPLLLETSADEEGQPQTRRAVEQGATLVVAAGGDGTVRAVAEALRGTSAALAILPSGTGNLLARNLDLPLSNLDDACAIAFSGADRAIDIGVATLARSGGEVEEHAFVVMAGLGLDAAMIAKTRPVLKRRFGWLAYVDAGFRAAPTKVRVAYTLDDDEERTAHASTILIANCGSLPGRIELIPDALIDDGRLDIAVLQPKSWFGWLLIWRRVTWENRVLRRTALGQRIIRMSNRGRRGRRTELTYLRGESVRLTVAEPEPFELDGDQFGDVIGVDLTVEHQALRVRVPARS